MNAYIFLFARLLTLLRVAQASPVVCSMPEGGSTSTYNEGITSELNDWVRDSTVEDVTHANSQKIFPIYSGTYTGTNITISLVSVLPGYFVPLDGVKGIASSIWSECQNGGSQTDAEGNFVDITSFAKWGNCEENQTLSGTWNLGSAVIVLCIWDSTLSFTSTTTTTTTSTSAPLCQGQDGGAPVTCAFQI